MAVIFTDEEIEELIGEKKYLPPDHRTHSHLLKRRGHWKREWRIKGERGNDFEIKLRKSMSNPLGFSVILGVYPRKSSKLFRHDDTMERATNIRTISKERSLTTFMSIKPHLDIKKLDSKKTLTLS